MWGFGTVFFVVPSVSSHFPLPFFCSLGEGSSYPASVWGAKGGDTDGREGVIASLQNVCLVLCSEVYIPPSWCLGNRLEEMTLL